MKKYPWSQMRLLIVTSLAAFSLFGVFPDARAAGNPRLSVGFDLGRKAHGEDAVTLLGSKLPEVAAAYGLRPTELDDLLRKHSSMWVSREGDLLYLCEGLAISNTTTVQNSATATIAAGNTIVATTSSTLTLHSTPGAARVIYLDFTGHTTSGTSWNSGFTGGANIVSQPFDLDGDPSSFSDAECAFIYRVWQRVAEDFAPFAVDVTTEDPGIEALRYSGTGDNAYGQRVVISPTNWYNTNAGGVSYVGSFNWPNDTPNFIFTQQLANGEKYIAEAISHETGHALGLNHSGLSGSGATEYYSGQGDWAPIMGNSYYRPVTQWSKGEYLNANNAQDQLAVMQSYGAPLVANIYGSTLASATPVSGPTFTVAGTIMNRSDTDLFRFNTGSGTISLTVSDLTPEPNMNINVQLLDGSGAVLQIGTPSVTSVTLTASVPAGTYYLKINGIGNGDPLTSGYSNYASLGDYVFTGSLVATATNQAPVANIAAAPATGAAPLPVSFSSAGSVDSDGSIVSFLWAFGDGSTSIEQNPSHTYTSPGNYSVSLTVTDNGGLTANATTSITVTAPSNQAPMAVVSASTSSGIAPLPITFSGAGSYDLDGMITSYRWDFGDGTSSTAMSPVKTYNSPGNYTARLTVTDNVGATNSSSISLSVSSPPPVANPDTDVDVAQFNLAIADARSGTTASATVLILDRLGRPAANVTVTIQWAGVVSGVTSGKTDAAGKVVLVSGRSKKSGATTATITAITPPNGTLYDSAIYAEPLVRSASF